MKRESPIQSFIKSGTVQLLLAIAGVAVALLNVWLASRISPISERITSLDVWAANHEKVQEQQIVPRLDRIETKLDTLMLEINN